MKRFKNIIGILAIALTGSVIGVALYAHFFQAPGPIVTLMEKPFEFVKLPSAEPGEARDFVYAAEKTVHGVVHVKTEAVRETYYRNPLYEFFYGEKYKESQAVVGFGSGVIVSANGYIVTNNHVVDNSERISVTLNDKRDFSAKLVGKDPSTDLAVLKIDSDNLHFIPYGNSDELRVGEWVLAVGNPFNLTSTVTAGIVSAKGRSLGIISDSFRLESFIQTDAAVNRGNSGGALVNSFGELVGINTAIVSPSGGSVGNSFAIPVSIVKKVVADIIEFGTVQRAILGVTIQDVNSELARQENLGKITGVYVSSTTSDGAARMAGIEKGDIIIEINGIVINSTSELQEQISRFRPGDKVQVTILRKNKKKLFEVILRNKQGEARLTKPIENEYIYGARFKQVDPADKYRLGIKNGAQIVKLKDGIFRKEGMKENFIITKINNKPVFNANDVEGFIHMSQGKARIEGVYPNGIVAFYSFEK